MKKLLESFKKDLNQSTNQLDAKALKAVALVTNTV